MFQKLKNTLNKKLSSAFSWYPKTCSICLTRLKSEKGQAIFTAECNHTFHFSCIAASVEYGNKICPLCRANWKDIPFPAPYNTTGYSDPFSIGVHPGDFTVPNIGSFEPKYYTDDEPLPQASPSISKSSASNVVTLKIFPEYPAVAASESLDKFPALVKVCAPQLLQRAPVDLVCVLDVSTSMQGSKISLLKSAMHFVIQNLSHKDRLSIITFSNSAQRVFPLRRMSDKGCEDARSVIDSILANGGTHIVKGLEKGVQVLRDRKHHNPVSSIILLSDGRDTFNYFLSQDDAGGGQKRAEFINLLPNLIQGCDRKITIPVHTFGFGTDHDSNLMHTISDASGGTFSFIESIDIIQESFAMCIGGLLSVVVKDLDIEFRSLADKVHIKSFSTGNYKSEISHEGRQGSIYVGNLYAEEEKDFLIHLTVPKFSNSRKSEKTNKTLLLDISCSYKSLHSEENIQIQDHTFEINRPEILSPNDMKVSLEVDNKRNRLLVAEAIAEAHQLAEAGDLVKAQNVLESRLDILRSSAMAKADDSVYLWLESELIETKNRMKTMEAYRERGRAYALSGLSSHLLQRATTKGSRSSNTMEFSGRLASMSGPIAYETPRMVSMVTISQELKST